MSKNSQYNDMNAGALRQPPPQISAPCLTWQRAFWRSEKNVANDKDPPELDDWTWWRSIDNTLAHIFNHIHFLSKPHYVCPNFDRATDYPILYLLKHRVTGIGLDKIHLEQIPPEELTSRHSVFTVRAPIDGVNVVVSARLHLEYFVLMFAVELPSMSEGASSNPVVQNIIDSFRNLHTRISTRYSEQKINNSPVDADELSIRSNSAKDYHNLISNLREFVGNLSGSISSHRKNSLEFGLNLCGEMFADFMGIIYGLEIGNDGQTLSPFTAGETLVNTRVSARIQGSEFLPYYASAVLDAAWPVIGASGRRPEDEKNYGEPEYAVAAFNGGRTIYVSALGHLAPAPRPQAGQLIYTLIVSYKSQWRLGRFIDRLNTLGVLRLAALRDLHSINKSSNIINTISAILAKHRIDRAHNVEFSNINYLHSKIGEDIFFGLMHRIERSRYYVFNYNIILETLNPQRVPGFQFYVDFIKSRIFDAFDYIDRVGKRYDDIVEEINFQINLTQRDQIRNLQAAMLSQIKSTTLLLSIADKLALIPLTYYLGSMLERSKINFKEVEIFHKKYFGRLPGEGEFWNFLFAFVVVFFITRWIGRMVDAKVSASTKISFRSWILLRWQIMTLRLARYFKRADT